MRTRYTFWFMPNPLECFHPEASCPSFCPIWCQDLMILSNDCCYLEDHVFSIGIEGGYCIFHFFFCFQQLKACLTALKNSENLFRTSCEPVTLLIIKFNPHKNLVTFLSLFLQKSGSEKLDKLSKITRLANS